MGRLVSTMTPNPDCVFCQIAAGEIPTESVYDDGEIMAFPDIHPQAPIHLLIIPKDHVLRSMAEMTEDLEPLIGRMFRVARQLGEEQGIADNGYRLVFNVRSHGGQEVDHLHLHLLGGQDLGPLGK